MSQTNTFHSFRWVNLGDILLSKFALHTPHSSRSWITAILRKNMARRRKDLSQSWWSRRWPHPTLPLREAFYMSPSRTQDCESNTRPSLTWTHKLVSHSTPSPLTVTIPSPPCPTCFELSGEINARQATSVRLETTTNNSGKHAHTKKDTRAIRLGNKRNGNTRMNIIIMFLFRFSERIN